MLAVSPPELIGSVDMVYLRKPVILLGKRYSISLPGACLGSGDRYMIMDS